MLLVGGKYAQAWHRASRQLQVDLGPMHSVRHSGPSHDMHSGYRSLWQVQRRGRWRSERSCLRYTKSHALVEAQARMPPEVMTSGAALYEQWGNRRETAQE